MTIRRWIAIAIFLCALLGVTSALTHRNPLDVLLEAVASDYHD
jgi:hypothetical protein